jgi:nucleoside-diphosphate-sugar epimerase
MRVVVIGGTGHIGTYLIPRLVTDGFEVISVSRQNRKPYKGSNAWDYVEQIKIDRVQADSEDKFAGLIKNLNPEIVIDLICFFPESAQKLVKALHGQVQHLLTCGTIWVHGFSEQVPTYESHPRKPFGDYGIKKAALESFLLSYSHKTGFPATVLHPGHIVGPGWIPLNPAGNFNPEVYRKLARGENLCLPNLGLETVHHVHADDVARAFISAINNRSTSVGESFHVVSGQALTLRGYAMAISRWFGKEAHLDFLPWEEWKKTVSEKDAAATWDHIAHSPNCSIEKAKRSINFNPAYTSLQAVQEALTYLIEKESLLAN